MKLLLSFLLLTMTLFANVDINHANLKELTTLKGVGTKTLEKNRDNLEAKKCEAQ